MGYARIRPLGIVRDFPAQTLHPELWSGGRNVMPREGMERARGDLRVYGTPTFPPRHLVQGISSSIAPVWVYGSDAPGIGLTDGASHVDVTPAGMVAPPPGVVGPWTSGVLNQVPVINAVGNVPWYWNRQFGPGSVLPLPGWPSGWQVLAMRAYRYHLIGIGVDRGSGYDVDAIVWSDRAPAGTIPSTWTPAATNEAGDASASAGGGVLIDGARLGTRFIVYKTIGCYALDYVGGTQVMTLQPLFANVGCWGRNCIGELAGMHVVLSDSDVVVHDGNSYESIADAQVRRSIMRAISADAAYRSFVAVDQLTQEAWICVPEVGETWPTLAYVWNRARGKWGVRELGYRASHIAQGQAQLQSAAAGSYWNSFTATWAETKRLWNDNSGRVRSLAGLVAASVEQVATYQVDGDIAAWNGEAMSWVIERTGLDLGEARAKLVTRIFPELRSVLGVRVDVSVCGQMTPDDPITWSAPVQWDAQVSDSVPVFVRGRYIGVRFSGGAVVEPPALTGFGVQFSVVGAF